MTHLRARLLALRNETLAVALALRDPRTPWYAKLIAAATVAYFLSPIDLIPDFIPLLGQLDDLLIVPIGVWLVVKLVPPAVMSDCRERAEAGATAMSPRGRWIAAAVVVSIWLAALFAIGFAVAEAL
jgi:uncharacterized membrane protein YkvA (DUF1232 family)